MCFVSIIIACRIHLYCISKYMNSGFDYWLLLGGLWLFLFGMYIFEEAIKNLMSKSMKNRLKKSVSNVVKGIFTWFFSTVLLQSSSVVSLIVLAFVGAWIFNLSNAVSVILWVNIAGPLWDIVLWTIWLEFNITKIALPMIWIGWLWLIFSHNYIKLKSFFKFIVWLGLLFLWLNYMKESMSVFTWSFDFSQYLWSNVLMYFLLWLVFTLIVQSSSATVVLTLTAASSGIVDMVGGMWIIMWAFLWTAVTTAIIWSIWWNYIKRQVAMSHVLFNLFSVFLWLLLFPILKYLFLDLLNFSNTVIWLSVFSIFFKVLWVVLMLPFLNVFVRLLTKIIKEKKSEYNLNIDKVTVEVPDAAVLAMKQDAIKLLKKVFVYNLHIRDIDENDVLSAEYQMNDVLKKEKEWEDNKLDIEYNHIKTIEEKIIKYWFILKSKKLQDTEIEIIDSIYQIISNLVYSAKYFKDIKQNIQDMQDSDHPFLASTYHDFRKTLLDLYKKISLIIDGKDHDKNFSDILDIFSDIKLNDKIFLSSLKKNIFKKKMDELQFSSMINVSRYISLSCFSLVSAVQKLFLSGKENLILDEIK